MLWSILSFFQEKFKGLPWGLIITLLLIIVFGLINLYSSSDAHLNPSRFHSQIVFTILGLFCAFIIGCFIDIRLIETFTLPFYILVCVLLLLVDISGSVAKGAERWINIGPLKLQPSELAKIVIILITAKTLQTLSAPPHGFSLLHFWKQFLYLAIPFVLIVQQPDLTTASIVMFIMMLQLLTLPVRAKSLLKAACIGFVVVLFAWFFLLHDYQRQRVLTFLNPMNDLQGSSYQSIQSMIAVGSGQWTGAGFTQGTQAKFKFLPERHTDLAFSVWGEEQGFFGCLLIIALYVILIFQIFEISKKAEDTFSSMVAIGVGIFFMLHFLINISMVIGVFPVAGIPLSFFGYGGTHIITALLAVGLVMNVARGRQTNA